MCAFIMFMFDFASSVRSLIAAAAAADAIVVVILLLHIIAGIELLWFERKGARARARSWAHKCIQHFICPLFLCMNL